MSTTAFHYLSLFVIRAVVVCCSALLEAEDMDVMEDLRSGFLVVSDHLCESAEWLETLWRLSYFVLSSVTALSSLSGEVRG